MEKEKIGPLSELREEARRRMLRGEPITDDMMLAFMEYPFPGVRILKFRKVLGGWKMTGSLFGGEPSYEQDLSFDEVISEIKGVKSSHQNDYRSISSDGPLRKFLEDWKPIIPRKKLVGSEGQRTILRTGGAIIEEVTLYGTKGSKVVSALFDTGAEPCVIEPSLADEIGVTEVGVRKVETPFGPEYEIKEVELEKIVIRGKERPKPRAAVATPVGVDFLVGRDVMEWIGIKLEPKKLRMTINPSNPITNRPIELLGGIW